MGAGVGWRVRRDWLGDYWFWCGVVVKRYGLCGWSLVVGEWLFSYWDFIITVVGCGVNVVFGIGVKNILLIK